MDVAPIEKVARLSISRLRNVEQREKKKLTATIRVVTAHRGVQEGSLGGEQKRVSKFPRGDVPEFSQGGGRGSNAPLCGSELSHFPL